MVASLKRPRRSKRYTAPEFRPYTTALGQLTLAWNDLQEGLGALYWTITAKPGKRGGLSDYTPLKVWHSIRSDRSQRQMLEAAIANQEPNALAGNLWKRPRLLEDGKWLLDRAQSLEDSRNDAVHSPLFSTTHSLFGQGLGGSQKEPIRPASWQFNPRAIKLEKRDSLLREFRYCRDKAIILADFAHLMDVALLHPERSWPDRPELPTREPKTSPPNRRHLRE